MKRMRTAAAAIILALALTATAPSAAVAYTPDPPVGTSCPQVDGGIAAVVPQSGQACVIANIQSIFANVVISGQIALQARLIYSFVASEQVTFTLQGRGVQGYSLASVHAAPTGTVSLPKTASLSGAVPVTITVPANLPATYTRSAVGSVTGAVPDLTFTVPSAGPDDILTGTGQDAAALSPAWIGGGILVALGLLLTGFSFRRRRAA